MCGEYNSRPAAACTALPVRRAYNLPAQSIALFSVIRKGFLIAIEGLQNTGITTFTTEL